MRFTILLLSLLTQTGLVAQTTYDVFTYTEPKGFKKETKPGTVTYTKTDSKAGTYCIINLYAQSPSSGDLAKDFDNDWAALVATPLSVTAAPQKDNGDEITSWKTYSGGANFEFGGGTSMALLTTAKKDNANVAILIVTNSQAFLTTDVDVFFNKLSLAKPKAPNVVNANISPANNTASNPNLTGGGIIGVWTCYRNTYPSTILSWYYKVFFNNGKSLDVMTVRGLYNYNVTTETNLSVGTYSFANGKGANYKYAGQKSPDVLQLIKNNQLKIDNNTYYKSESINGAKLNASFTSFANPNDPQLEILSYGEKPKITFYSTGKFKDEGLFNTYLFDKVTNPAAAKPGNGVYELKDFSIILKYDDGRTRQQAFVPAFGGNIQNAAIILLSNGASLNKIKENTEQTKPASINKNILGEWYLSDGNAKITLLFAASGKYDKGAMVDRRIVSNLYETTNIKGKGNYTLNGNTLTLIPNSSTKETYQIRIAFESNSEGKIEKKLYLKRPVEGGTIYESEYWFVK
jgi:hypothetical protein